MYKAAKYDGKSGGYKEFFFIKFENNIINNLGCRCYVYNFFAFKHECVKRFSL